MERDIELVAGVVGGAVGNAVEAGCDGYNTYEDVKHHNYSGAVVSGVETLYHGGEAVLDGMDGDWIF